MVGVVSVPLAPRAAPLPRALEAFSIRVRPCFAAQSRTSTRAHEFPALLFLARYPSSASVPRRPTSAPAAPNPHPPHDGHRCSVPPLHAMGRGLGGGDCSVLCILPTQPTPLHTPMDCPRRCCHASLDRACRFSRSTKSPP